ncbi:MAG: AAA family ATPase, partial [Oscillospiraceae bacterium]
NEFERHQYVYDSGVLPVNKHKRFEKILIGNAKNDAYLTALQLLSECLEKYHNKKVILLIDEYDVPLENAHFRGFYDEMVSLIRSVFESVLKTNPSLEFAVLTGCLRVSKESIFTGMNNLRMYPVTDNSLSEYYGFTQSEVEELADYYDMQDKLDEMKTWYDGYLFGKTEIYNSWSIVNYISSVRGGNDISCKAYWINTSSNSIIRQLIEKSDENTRQKIENLTEGGSVKALINENSVYSDLDVNDDDIWSFLLFTGYLKQISSEFTEDGIVSEMVIPNLEVRTVYKRTIRKWFEQSVKSEGTEALLKAMLEEKPEEVENEISKWLQKSISYHDTLENFYHGFLVGLLEGFKGYEVKSNRENRDGRTDITVCERYNRKAAIVIEIKPAETFKQLKTQCENAVKQIRDNKYAEQFTDDCYQKVISYGISFYGKTCRVKMGETLFQPE